MGHGLAQKKTLPKPLYTEATLLAAMETCGKNITDEQAKEAIKDLGIGTPATRAAIITTLVKRDYIARSGKSIIPTEKGMYIYEAVKDMRVADVELTGSWEKTLAQVERHTLDTETFMQSIRDYTRRQPLRSCAWSSRPCRKSHSPAPSARRGKSSSVPKWPGATMTGAGCWCSAAS